MSSSRKPREENSHGSKKAAAKKAPAKKAPAKKASREEGSRQEGIQRRKPAARKRLGEEGDAFAVQELHLQRGAVQGHGGRLVAQRLDRLRCDRRAGRPPDIGRPPRRVVDDQQPGEHRFVRRLGNRRRRHPLPHGQGQQDHPDSNCCRRGTSGWPARRPTPSPTDRRASSRAPARR